MNQNDDWDDKHDNDSAQKTATNVDGTALLPRASVGSKQARQAPQILHSVSWWTVTVREVEVLRKLEMHNASRQGEICTSGVNSVISQAWNSLPPSIGAGKTVFWDSLLVQEGACREILRSAKEMIDIWGACAVKRRASTGAQVQGNPELNTRGENCKTER